MSSSQCEETSLLYVLSKLVFRLFPFLQSCTALKTRSLFLQTSCALEKLRSCNAPKSLCEWLARHGSSTRLDKLELAAHFQSPPSASPHRYQVVTSAAPLSPLNPLVGRNRPLQTLPLSTQDYGLITGSDLVQIRSFGRDVKLPWMFLLWRKRVRE